MNPTTTIYERLAVMSVSYSRVTDERTLPGAIAHTLPGWTAADGTDAGCIALFVGPQTSELPFRDNIVVICTRFVFDHGVKPADLIDHAYVDARALEGWQEETVRRWPAQGRHSGWALQTGTYISGPANLFAASTYAVHERGNVGYLVQTTATVIESSEAPVDHAGLVAEIQTVNFVD